MRGFIHFCLVGLCCGVLVGAFGVGAEEYWWNVNDSECPGVGVSPQAAADAAGFCGQPCTNAVYSERSFVQETATRVRIECRRLDYPEATPTGATVSRYGDGCPAGSTYQGDPWWRCVGEEPAPPAQKGDPCIRTNTSYGYGGTVVDRTNCSVYASAGGVDVCTAGGCWGEWCPTGNQAEGCTPSDWVPQSPDDSYTPDPSNFEESDSCSNCDGSAPGVPAPENGGQPDPDDPDGGNFGDEHIGGESTTTTHEDGTTVTTENGINFNPYSGAYTRKETTTTTRPDGTSTREETTTTTTPNGSGGSGGTTTTRTNVRTEIGADGSETTFTEGSSTVTDGEGEKEAPKTSAGGGVSCAAEPTCSGDPIQCGILKQIWRDNCVFSKVSGGDSCDAAPVCDSSQLACAAVLQAWHDRCPQGAPDQAGINAAVDALVPAGEMTVAELDAAVASDPDYSPDAEVDLSSISIGPTNPSPSGSCPLPFSITVMGVDVAIGSTELCDFTDWISWLVRISASLFALFIITGYGVGRSTGGA